jgi:hypothetical protein
MRKLEHFIATRGIVSGGGQTGTQVKGRCLEISCSRPLELSGLVNFGICSIRFV